MKSFIKEQISEFKTYLLAPFYFHFGETTGNIIVFLLITVFIIRLVYYLVYYRNYYFKAFSEFYFNLINLLSNRRFLFNYISSFFTSLKNGISFFFTKIKSFFKR